LGFFCFFDEVMGLSGGDKSEQAEQTEQAEEADLTSSLSLRSLSATGGAAHCAAGHGDGRGAAASAGQRARQAHECGGKCGQ